MAYVTGSHNFKVGFTSDEGFNDESRARNHRDELDYDFLNGLPNRIQYRALPHFQQERMRETGLFAQDAWTVRNLTLTGGIRWDYVVGSFPSADLPAGLYVPARHVDAQSGVPQWSDISPRFGAAWNVFGDGRTAVRFSMGRYVSLTGSNLTRSFHPFSSSVVTAFRNWNDLMFPVGDPRRGNYIPDCDLKNFSVNGECQGMSSQFFGQFQPQATLFDDSVTKGNRFHTWDTNVEVQHELIPGLGLSVGYNQNWDRNFTVTENVLFKPADYDEFCITAPVDARLPNGGGYEQCGFYDVKPALFGQGQQRTTLSKEFGNQKRTWHGFSFAADGRLPRGISIGGGIGCRTKRGRSVLCGGSAGFAVLSCRDGVGE